MSSLYESVPYGDPGCINRFAAERNRIYGDVAEDSLYQEECLFCKGPREVCGCYPTILPEQIYQAAEEYFSDLKDAGTIYKATEGKIEMSPCRNENGERMFYRWQIHQGTLIKVILPELEQNAATKYYKRWLKDRYEPQVGSNGNGHNGHNR